MKNVNYNIVLELLNKYKKHILYVILGLAVMYGMIYIFTPKPQMPKEYKDAIKALNKSNKDLIKKQKQLDNNIAAYESEIKKLDYKINNIKEKTTIIKEYYTQQGIAADNYTPTQVDSFFKARYNY